MKQKQYVVISCPAETYSGYGSRARDFVKATIEAKKDEWDVWIMSQKWGNTPWGYLDDHEKDWGWMKKHILFNNQMTQKPDVWMQISIPNEFQPIGNFNIGVTAGIETTICDPEWIDGLNRMDLNLVSSKHSADVFKATQAEQRTQDGKVIRNIKLEKPVEIIFEGVDLNTYFEIPDNELPEVDVVSALDEIEESFAFLFVGHWLQGEIGEDRKNVGQMIKVFLETFKNKHNAPALVLKTAIHNGSIMDWTDTMNKINAIKKTVNAKKLPNIYLLHGELEECEINYLYNHPKIKAMINMTKGEGFGRPLLEFSLFKKPMIVSGWSGQLDFLNPEFITLVPGQLRQIHPSAVVDKILVKESSWFNADPVFFAEKMIDVWSNYKKYEVGAKRQAHYAKSTFSFEKMQEKLGEYYTNYVKETPKLVLPQLPKLPKLTKIK
jgi:glycosyltransferase involved in cell wall biosynthesis